MPTVAATYGYLGAVSEQWPSGTPTVINNPLELLNFFDLA